MFKRSSGEYGASFVKNKFRVISDVHKLINRTHLARRALYPTHVVHEVWLISSQTWTALKRKSSGKVYWLGNCHPITHHAWVLYPLNC